MSFSFESPSWVEESLFFNEHVPRLVNKVSRQLGLLSRVTMQLKEGRTGVLLWCVISSFYFPWNVSLGNYSSWLVIWKLCVIREEPELLIDIRDLTTLYHVIFRCSPPNGQSLYAICNMEHLLSHLRSYFLQILLLVQEQFIKRSILLAYFCVSGKQNFHIHDPSSSIPFVNHARDPPLRPSWKDF